MGHESIAGKVTDLAKPPRCRTLGGPVSKAACAVSAKPRLGALTLLQRSCDDLMRMSTVCAQMRPMTAVPTAPNASPAFLKATGMASTPDPKLPFRRCARAPKSLETTYMRKAQQGKTDLT